MLVDSQKCPNVRSKEGQIFIDWLISAKGQAAIASFTFDGKQLFFPNAR
jgi:tungstate transport system substrate-binding protein